MCGAHASVGCVGVTSLLCWWRSNSLTHLIFMCVAFACMCTCTTLVLGQQRPKEDVRSSRGGASDEVSSAGSQAQLLCRSRKRSNSCSKAQGSDSQTYLKPLPSGNFQNEYCPWYRNEVSYKLSPCPTSTALQGEQWPASTGLLRQPDGHSYRCSKERHSLLKERTM